MQVNIFLRLVDRRLIWPDFVGPFSSPGACEGAPVKISLLKLGDLEGASVLATLSSLLDDIDGALVTGALSSSLGDL